MQNTNSPTHAEPAEYFLDITGEVCPLTFVRARLLVERMPPGATGEIRLMGEEPLSNVPRAIEGLGHAILSLTPEDPAAGPHGVHRLRIRIR